MGSKMTIMQSEFKKPTLFKQHKFVWQQGQKLLDVQVKCEIK